MHLLALQVTVALVGLGCSLLLYAAERRDLAALRQSGRNGANLLLVRADLRSELLRIAKHVLVLIPAVVALSEGRGYRASWFAIWLLGLTAAIGLGSLVDWHTRKALRDEP